MRDDDAGRLQFSDLRRNFLLDLFAIKLLDRYPKRKIDQALPKARGRASNSQAGNLFPAQNRGAIYQDHMTADAQSGGLNRKSGRFLKLGSASHERGGGHYSAPVAFQNASIHSRSEAKIVRIDDEPAHACEFSRARLRRASFRIEV